ncbi:hypothetical protein KVR01_009996 [Diaporthe batatas]|uniref:uncharacterized protein n=1 Tax=Diaporthe batatas TaxID=748121 RepID=UPI001D04943C|nr:uncharacterized protein KVR01_009996 [Diaporthe batatas]KAG8160460.1 hypothetical protein KVR01_009996 [Diaporthe batatas]
MASPLSVGDCIAIVGIVVKGFQALSSTSEDSRVLAQVRSDLDTLSAVLTELSAADSQEQARFRSVVQGCYANLKNLRQFTKKYSDGSSVAVSRYFKRLRYSLSGKDELDTYRQGLQQSLISLLLLQSERQRVLMSTGSRQIQGEIQHSSNQFQLQLLKATSEVKFEIARGLEDPWDTKPLQFQDAIGRRYPIPLEICATFEDFVDFLLFSFKKNPAVLTLVSTKQFWLFTPPKNNNADRWWYLINEHDWKAVARPGTQFGMSLFFGDQSLKGPQRIEGSSGTCSGSASDDDFDLSSLSDSASDISDSTSDDSTAGDVREGFKDSLDCDIIPSMPPSSDEDTQAAGSRGSTKSKQQPQKLPSLACRSRPRLPRTVSMRACASCHYCERPLALAQQVIKFSKPTPTWNPLPDDLEFRWLSSAAKFGPLSMTDNERRHMDSMSVSSLIRRRRGRHKNVVVSRLGGSCGDSIQVGAWRRKAVLSCA